MGFMDLLGEALGQEIVKQQKHLNDRKRKIERKAERYSSWSIEELKREYENANDDEKFAIKLVLKERGIW